MGAGASLVLPAGGLIEADLGVGVLAGFTRRVGGRSAGPWAELNLGLHVGDDPAAVGANRTLVAAWAGAPVAFGRQVHGTAIRLVTDDDARFDLAGGDLDVDSRTPGCDGLVTRSRSVAVGVLVADCVPVLLAEPGAGVVAAVHAGRRGVVGGVIERAVEILVALGADPSRVRAVLGPAAGGCCYEVPAALQDEASAALPALRSTTTWGTPSLDLREGCRSVLERLGVTDVTRVGGCTIEDATGYSYRQAATTGRFAGVVRLLG